MKPNQPLLTVALKHAKAIHSGGQAYKIPSLEMAIALKFGPMVSPNRGETRKLQDAHDFRQVVESNSEIDLEILRELGELVYSGGGAELLEMVRQVRAGGKLIL